MDLGEASIELSNAVDEVALKLFFGESHADRKFFLVGGPRGSESESFHPSDDEKSTGVAEISRLL